MPNLSTLTTSEQSVFQTSSSNPQPSTHLLTHSLLIPNPRSIIPQQPASSDLAIPRSLHSQSSPCDSKSTRRWSAGATHDHSAFALQTTLESRAPQPRGLDWQPSRPFGHAVSGFFGSSVVLCVICMPVAGRLVRGHAALNREEELPL